MSDPQTKLQTLLNEAVSDGRERGVQLAVYQHGKLVIDAWAGTLDVTSPAKVKADTLFPVFSCTKGLVATLANLLVERGKISYDTPIASVWPEFAAHGKGDILFRHALNHTAGLQFMPVGMPPEEMAVWENITAVMASMPPTSPPGKQQVYHAVTSGWIVGEVMRRVDGRGFAEMLDDEIKKPLGLNDTFVGLPAELDDRVAILDEVFEPGTVFPSPDDRTPREVAVSMRPLHAWMNSTLGRRNCVPASNGISTARDLARLYASLLPGGIDGVEILPPARIKLATERLILPNPDGTPSKKQWALGYVLGGDPNGMGSRDNIFGHAGYGGSNAWADPDYGLAVGFTKNFYSSKGAQGLIFRTVREALGIPH